MRHLAAYQALMFCVLLFSASTDTIDENTPIVQKLLGFILRAPLVRAQQEREKSILVKSNGILLGLQAISF